VIFFPNGKINLGLQILRRRPDGYHDLSTVFYPLPVTDILEILPSTVQAFSAYGLPIPGDPSTNLCEKAYGLLKADFPLLPPIHLHLYKNIPIGAGLGGGSADGAFTLLALNKTFRLNQTPEQLQHYAARLGSDCPFFILNKPCLGAGRGEQLDPIPLDLSAYGFILVNPQVHISTARAFAGCRPREDRIPLRDIIQQPITTWRDQLTNDFETSFFQLYPQLAEIKETLYAHGALYASLTGSGSSFYGIFPKTSLPATLPLSYNYRILH